MRHVLDGNHERTRLGYHDAAGIALTRSFVFQDTHAHAGIWRCSEAETSFMTSELMARTYTEFDRLNQLWDALALLEGICLLEKRLVDVALRHGLNVYTPPRWQAIMGLKEYLEIVVGGLLYRICRVWSRRRLGNLIAGVK